jgi:hypothetical protein
VREEREVAGLGIVELRFTRDSATAIVLVCLCGAGCLGALTAALVFYRKLVGVGELDKQSRRIIGIVLALAMGVPFVALMSVSDARQPVGTYVNGLVGQYLPIRSLFSYAVGFFYAWLAIRVVGRGRNNDGISRSVPSKNSEPR